MKAVWSWLVKEREFPGPLRYLDVFKLRRLVTLKRLIIFLCVVVVLHTAFNVWAYLALQQQLKKARAAGIELDIRKYDQPEVKRGQNAAHLYVAAFELLASMETGDSDVPGTVRDEWPESGSPSAELREKMSNFVNSTPVSLAMGLIEQGNRMPKCNWGLRYEDTFAMVLPHLAGVRNAARALLVRARLRYITGDAPGALADLQAVRELAQRIESDRIIISEFIQYAALDLWVTAVRQMSSAHHPDADTAGQMGDLLSPWEELLGTTEALKVETAVGYYWTEQVRGDPVRLAEVLEPAPGERRSEVWPEGLLASYPYRPLYRLDQARFLRSDLELVELSRKPYWTAKKRLEDWSVETGSHSPLFPLTRLLLPALGRVQMPVAKAQANLCTTRVGLTLEAYRAKTGSYPDSLAVLVPGILPELPEDPFTGTPLLHRLSDAEVLVYSVGENGIDDGGRRETRRKRKTLDAGTDDIAWRVAP
jgi:hypothetical protein